jgi:hypothetical protein
MNRSKAIRPPEGTVPLLIAAEKYGMTKKEAKEILLAVPQSFVKVGHKFFVNDFGDNLLKLRMTFADLEKDPTEEEPINEQALESFEDAIGFVKLSPVMESEQERSEDVPQVLNATQRLFADEETAIVKRCRLPNKQIMIVEYRGKEVICRCKDSSMFIPGMKIIIRMDGLNLMSKYQPRRLGRY